MKLSFPGALQHRRALNAQFPKRMNDERYFGAILSMLDDHEHNEINHTAPESRDALRTYFDELRKETIRRLKGNP
jgi:hypothetical protein